MNESRPAPWTEVRALFERALALPGSERDALLADPALDPALRAEARSLLAHAGVDAFLEAAADALPAATPAAPAPRRVGERLGPWRITARLGSGGMGEVWLAERADGAWQGQAAVKLLRQGLDSAAVLARFAQERQALARLAHPGIARLLDAGLGDAGEPYVVMEYVNGRPIDEAARERTLEGRLQLFLQLADAVAHAHRRLLVHRDLKPGNVLVDGEGQVKLLDFGIAKALDPLEAADASATLGGVRPFTPNYASPEQVRGEPVGTGTDIYSLGVLLYQLLTGLRPTGRRAVTAAEAARSVLEEEPTRPSRLPTGLVNDPQWLSTRRRLEGDLDHVLLMALEKSVERRYPSVDALAADLRAFLAGRPVGARAGGPGYVFGKFVQRNRYAVLAATVGGVGLLTGLVATLLQGRAVAALGVLGLAGGLGLALVLAQRAARARDVAEERLRETKSILRTLVQQHADAITHLPGGLPAKEAMLGDAIAALGRLERTAQGDAEIAATLAGSYARLAELQGNALAVSLGKPAAAEAHARKALEWFARVPAAAPQEAAFHAWQARAHALLGRLARDRGELAEALGHLQRSVGVLRTALARLPGNAELRRGLANKLAEIGQLHDTTGVPNLGQGDAALQWLGQARQMFDELLAQSPSLNDRLHSALVESACAIVHQKRDRLAEAIAHLERAAAITAGVVSAGGERDTTNRLGHAMTLNNLGYLRGRLGRYAEAVQASAAAFRLIEELQRQEPENPTWVTRCAVYGQGHAHALLEAGRSDEALALLRGFEPLWHEQGRAAAPGHEADTAQRRLAANRLDQARCLAAGGAPAQALACAVAAEESFAAFAQAAPADRERLIFHAEALALRARLDAPGRARWQAAAVARYDEAGRLQALLHDHLRARRALDAPAGAGPEVKT